MRISSSSLIFQFDFTRLGVFGGAISMKKQEIGEGQHQCRVERLPEIVEQQDAEDGVFGVDEEQLGR